MARARSVRRPTRRSSRRAQSGAPDIVPDPAMTRFTKGHGLGNDYLVMEERDLEFPLGPPAIRWICHRNWGVGSDGILSGPLGVADVGLRIFNPDGSEAEKSGNGLRIFAKYLWERGGLRSRPMRIETKGGVVEAVCHVTGERVDQVTVEMGHATFRAPEIPMHGPDREVVAVPLQVGRPLPHRDVRVHREPALRRVHRGARRRRGAFPRATDRDPCGLPQSHQRPVRAGAGARSGRDPDLGTRRRLSRSPRAASSCAVAAAAVRNGLAHGRITIQSPGGELGVEVRDDFSIRLSGPVAEACAGTLAPELVQALRAGDPLPFE